MKQLVLALILTGAIGFATVLAQEQKGTPMKGGGMMDKTMQMHGGMEQMEKETGGMMKGEEMKGMEQMMEEMPGMMKQMSDCMKGGNGKDKINNIPTTAFASKDLSTKMGRTGRKKKDRHEQQLNRLFFYGDSA